MMERFLLIGTIALLFVPLSHVLLQLLDALIGRMI